MSFDALWPINGPDEPHGMLLHKTQTCRYGTMVFPRSDFFIGRSLDIYGEYCQGEAMVFDQILSPGQVAVEVGANIGAHTIHLSKCVGQNGLVYAFEPQRLIFQTLCTNVVLNDAFNVRTFNAACGEKSGHVLVPQINFDIESVNFGGVSLLGATEGEFVPLVTLDSFSFPALRLLKIDAEGMELTIIEGARAQILRHRPILYLENDRREQSPPLISAIEALGYDLWWHVPSLFNKDNFRGTTENIFGGVCSINMICIPKEQPSSVIGFRKIAGANDWWE